MKSEKKKAARDFITKTFDTARDDVRKAVEAGVDYFPYEAKDRSPALEAKIWMGERDVRSSVSALIAFSGPTSKNATQLQGALDDFIGALTGGTFQSASAPSDLDQVRRVAASGANLRSQIWIARQTELQMAISSDVLTRSANLALIYMNENLGPNEADYYEDAVRSGVERTEREKPLP